MQETYRLQDLKCNKPYYTEHDIFKIYKNQYNIDKQQFVKIVQAFFVLLLKDMVNNGTVFYLPPMLGILGIVKQRLKKPLQRFDYVHYKATGEKIFLTNAHSEGWLAKFKWRLPNYRYKNTTFNNNTCNVRFIPSRFASRFLAKQIKQNNTIVKYYEY